MIVGIHPVREALRARRPLDNVGVESVVKEEVSNVSRLSNEIRAETHTDGVKGNPRVVPVP